MAGIEMTELHGGKKQPCCGIQMGQTGFLKLMIAVLAVLCIILGALLVALDVNKKRVDSDLTVELRELRVLVKDMETKLNATEQQMEKRLNATEQKVEKRLKATEQKVEKLQSEVQQLEGPKVAFSASLTASGVIRVFSSASPFLVYKRVITNIGNAYDSNTGEFTAPVKGIYYFSFSTVGLNHVLSGAILTKNGTIMVSCYDHPAIGEIGDIVQDLFDTGANSVILQLEAGEKVTMRLWENSEVYDNLNGLTTFSGFLLFPL
ncbi:heavy metal-binding protein HIP-like [Clupea harengus]|uniref:Heavy metal-binding protein HIP-like n=1 Tax=Clupea harengus TaxID=7950 RepID=A0A6P8GZA0_CLUHA|nr:heavy metal-binding protein HIP-like [Clupea harengus]XP_031440788.1 heavy metal-binding protein HIP-like [Clupea harengus]